MARPNVIDTWEQLIRFHRAATTAMDEHLRARTGLSLDDYDVLHQINAHDGPIRMGELAERLLVANSSCNRVVGRLVDGGLVERRGDEGDGRVRLVDLTPTGKRVWRRMAAVHSRDIEALFGAPLTATQVGAVDAALQQLLGSMPADSST